MNPNQPYHNQPPYLQQGGNPPQWQQQQQPPMNRPPQQPGQHPSFNPPNNFGPPSMGGANPQMRPPGGPMMGGVPQNFNSNQPSMNMGPGGGPAMGGPPGIMNNPMNRPPQGPMGNQGGMPPQGQNMNLQPQGPSGMMIPPGQPGFPQNQQPPFGQPQPQQQPQPPFPQQFPPQSFLNQPFPPHNISNQGQSSFLPPGPFNQPTPQQSMILQQQQLHAQQSQQQQQQQQQLSRRQNIEAKIREVRSIFPPNLRVTSPEVRQIALEGGQIPIALVCPTNLTFSLCAEGLLKQNGYTNVNSYATHTKLTVDKIGENISVAKTKGYHVYGCKKPLFVLEPTTGHPYVNFLDPYRLVIQQLQESVEALRNKDPSFFPPHLRDYGNHDLLNFLKENVNPRYIKPQPELFQDVFGFSLEQHVTHKSLLHHHVEFSLPADIITQMDRKDASTNGETTSSSSQISFNKLRTVTPHSIRRSKAGDDYLSSLSDESFHTPQFDIIFTYGTKTFIHVVDILQQANNSMKRPVHVINIPTSDELSNVPVAAELTLEFVNAIHISLQRSTEELTRTLATTQGPNGTAIHVKDLQNPTGETYIKRLNPFLKHNRNLIAHADDNLVMKQFWAQNIDLFIKQIEKHFKETILNVIVWL